MLKPLAARRRRVAQRLLAAGILGALAFLLATIAYDIGAFHTPDAAIDDALRDSALANALVPLGQALDHAGNILAVALLVGLLGLALLRERRHHDAAKLALAFLAVEATVLLLKFAFDRARPLDGIVDAGGASFPSGHAARGAFIALALAWYLAPRLATRPRARAATLAALALFAASMAAARLVLHVHYASDVTSGTLLGATITALALALPLQPRATTRRIPVSAPIQVTTPSREQEPAKHNKQ